MRYLRAFLLWIFLLLAMRSQALNPSSGAGTGTVTSDGLSVYSDYTTSELSPRLTLLADQGMRLTAGAAGLPMPFCQPRHEAIAEGVAHAEGGAVFTIHTPCTPAMCGLPHHAINTIFGTPPPSDSASPSFRPIQPDDLPQPVEAR